MESKVTASSLPSFLDSALKKATAASDQGQAILELDHTLFCAQASADFLLRQEAIRLLAEKFTDNQQEEQQKVVGVLLCDLVGISWKQQGLTQEIHKDLFESIVSMETESAVVRKFQSELLALLIFNPVSLELEKAAVSGENDELKQIIQDFFEPIGELISSGEGISIELGLLTLKNFLRLTETGDTQSRQLHSILPLLLPKLYYAFTDEAIEAEGRVQILNLFYIMIRSVAWSDGVEKDLLSECLDETFSSWMALFMQIIQSQPNQLFLLKKNALKCLTVIFRDLLNYSRDSINMILKPAWKLLNSHLPVFTEIVCYSQKTFGSDDIGPPERFDGVERMTFHLLELLCTLIQRPSIRPLVGQGLLPLATTVSSYLLVQHSNERMCVFEQTFFIADKSSDLLRATSIRHQALSLLSGMIEVFGDLAVSALLFVTQNIFATTTLDLQHQSSVANRDLKKRQAQIVPEERKDHSDQKQIDEIEEENRERAEFKALLEEFVYISDHPNNIWKRREVALLLVGTFAEDISMFMLRNPQIDFVSKVFDQLLLTNFGIVPKSLKQNLLGRTLWACACVCDLTPSGSAGENFMKSVLDLNVKTISDPDNTTSVKLIAIRCLIKFSRKFKGEELAKFASKFETILDPLLGLLNSVSLECMSLPIEAFVQFSKTNEQTVAQLTPKVTPQLLQLFKNHHHEGALGAELISLFKLWCNYEQCRKILIDTFLPQALQMVGTYYNFTPNVENKAATMTEKLASLALVDKFSTAKSKTEEEYRDQEKTVDASILFLVLDLACVLLKKARNDDVARSQIVGAFFVPLLDFVEKSDDMFLLCHGTTTLKSFIHLAPKEILELSTAITVDIIRVSKKLLSPSTNEQAALCLGNLIIQIGHKIQPKIDTSLLMCVVTKIYKSRMPSIVQSLVLIFARLIQTNPKEIVTFLTETSIDNRICLKIVLDKWLLQQPLFRGSYTKTVTLSSLCKLLLCRDTRVETLMVIGYNPSHSNVNSEVNAPFKILSTLLRFLENEAKPTKLRPLRQPVDIDPEDVEASTKQTSAFGGSSFGGYSMKKEEQKESELEVDSGKRMDTMGHDDDYDDQSDGGRCLDEIADEDKLDVNLDDIQDDENDEDVIDLRETPASKQDSTSTGSSQGNQFFSVGASNDKGLADMETGSEVYMSELLAGFDMDDFDEADEANEDDLVELGDQFAKVDLVQHVKESLNSLLKSGDEGFEYIFYCLKQLPKEDQELAKKLLSFPKSAPQLL